MKRTVLSLFAIFFAGNASLHAQPEWRVFTSTTGSKLEARVVSVDEDDVVLIRKADGKQFTLALVLLSY